MRDVFCSSWGFLQRCASTLQCSLNKNLTKNQIGEISIVVSHFPHIGSTLCPWPPLPLVPGFPWASRLGPKSRQTFEPVRVVEPLRQDSDNEDSEGEAQVYAKGANFVEERRGTKKATVTKIPVAAPAAQSCSSSISARVQPSPRQIYAKSATAESVDIVDHGLQFRTAME